MNYIKTKKILPFLMTLLLVLMPVLVGADDEWRIIPCDNDCNFEDFIQLINNIIDWIIKISVPVATGVIAWAGFVYMTTAVSDKKSEAKGMLKKVFIGFAVILSAWIIVHTLLGALLSDDFQDLPVQVGLSNLINTYV